MKAITTLSMLLVTLAVPATAWAETYTYDSRGRITHVVYDDGSEVDFSWDANGNLTRREVVAAAVTPEQPPGGGGQPDDGCGCSSATSRPLSFILLGGLAACLRRRRRTRCAP